MRHSDQAIINQTTIRALFVVVSQRILEITHVEFSNELRYSSSALSAADFELDFDEHRNGVIDCVRDVLDTPIAGNLSHYDLFRSIHNPDS